MTLRPLKALTAGGIGFLTGLGAALVLGQILRPVVIDQPIGPADLVGWGLRWGLLLGTFSACGAALGHRRTASMVEVVASSLAAAATLVAASLLGGLLAVAALRLGWYGQGWDLPSPATYALRIGATGAAEVLGLPLAIAAAVGLAAARRRG